ncbi:XshC-Cox1 family protein [Nocardia sp. SYP-A9097]|uniref:XdhC family protein n=1 Tax=Nocardia sp. SYP-A9097 TaxID=2663237 RepID=UPI00129AD376|nr:XdhC/CoxI family protein [Nocardia sp. SYP-A9097]MRH87932.1 XshC-Cox1 family protein [Nocardia sp. SYP-A9097]
MSALISPDADPITLEWFTAGKAFALATVVDTLGSAPMPVGSTMAVGPDGSALGSVSGGCVEGAVYESACEIRDSGIPRLETFGYTDAEGFAVGLTCGGTVTVLVQRIDRDTFPDYDLLLRKAAQDRAVAWATALPGHPESAAAQLIRTPDSPPPDALPPFEGAVARVVDTMLSVGVTGTRTLPGATPARLFVRSLTPAPKLVIIGATAHAAALSRLGRCLGMHVTVCDPRPVFATPQRFPDAHEVVRTWPHHYLSETRLDAATAVCVLTHDTKVDVPALMAAFDTPAGYIGAMGSLTTHHDRLRRLRAAGATPRQIARLHSPIGLDLGARSPQDIALSILAEIVSSRTGASGTPLTRSAYQSAAR